MQAYSTTLLAYATNITMIRDTLVTTAYLVLIALTARLYCDVHTAQCNLTTFARCHYSCFHSRVWAAIACVEQYRHVLNTKQLLL